MDRRIAISALASGVLAIMAVWTPSGPARAAETDCRLADWQMVGREDGRNGRPHSFKERTQACGLSPPGFNATLYDQGYDAGLAIYCAPENGYRLGRANARFSDVCPAESAAAFLAAYREGLYDWSVDAGAAPPRSDSAQTAREASSDWDKATNGAGKRDWKDLWNRTPAMKYPEPPQPSVAPPPPQPAPDYQADSGVDYYVPYVVPYGDRFHGHHGGWGRRPDKRDWRDRHDRPRGAVRPAPSRALDGDRQPDDGDGARRWRN